MKWDIETQRTPALRGVEDLCALLGVGGLGDVSATPSGASLSSGSVRILIPAKILSSSGAACNSRGTGPERAITSSLERCKPSQDGSASQSLEVPKKLSGATWRPGAAADVDRWARRPWEEIRAFSQGLLPREVRRYTQILQLCENRPRTPPEIGF